MENGQFAAAAADVSAGQDVEQMINGDEEKEPIDVMLAKYKGGWTQTIISLNEKMRTLPKVDELLNEVYMRRENAVEQFFKFQDMVRSKQIGYNRQYAQMYNAIKLNGFNGIRFTSDQQITRQIDACLEMEKMVISALDNHADFLKETIATLDKLIFGIHEKVEIHKILNGLKF